jgi:hypothetical protein
LWCDFGTTRDEKGVVFFSGFGVDREKLLNSIADWPERAFKSREKLDQLLFHCSHDRLNKTKRTESFSMSSPAPTVPYVEPWLRGTDADVPAVARAILHALDLALDDITKWTEGLTDSEVNLHPLGLPSLAFHLRHIARSVDRILTYAEGNQLTSEQLSALKAERAGKNL